MALAIQLSRDRQIIVDDDFDRDLLKYAWYISKKGYVRTLNPRTKEEITLHRLLTTAPSGMLVDHENGDKLDNRLCNLRVCTHAENSRNRKVSSLNLTGYKGVSKRGKKYIAEIQHNHRRILLGKFTESIDAAKAYDEAAMKYHGKFAKTNFGKSKVPEPIIKETIYVDFSLRADNTSGYKCVTKLGNKWRARIQRNGRRVQLGVFKQIEDAHRAVLQYEGGSSSV